MVWITADGLLHAAQWPQMRASPCPAADAPHAARPDLSRTQHQQEAPASQDLALPAEKRGDQSAKSGLVRRHHLHPDAARVPVSCGNHGLVQPEGPEMAAFEVRLHLPERI